MNRIKVWLRPVGDATKVQVEGQDNSDWLRQRFQERGFTCSSPRHTPGTDRFVFRAEYTVLADRSAVGELLRTFPEVDLMHAPE